MLESFEEKRKVYLDELNHYYDIYDDPGDDPDGQLLGQYCDNLRYKEIPKMLKLTKDITQCAVLYGDTLNNKRHFLLRKAIIEKAAELTKDSPKRILELLPCIKETIYDNDEKEEKMNEELRQMIQTKASVSIK